MRGNIINASIDAEKIITMHDSTYKEGMAGLGSSYNKVELDSMEIR
jgi:hypothetical protein